MTPLLTADEPTAPDRTPYRPMRGRSVWRVYLRPPGPSLVPLFITGQLCFWVDGSASNTSFVDRRIWFHLDTPMKSSAVV
jgi:hypothetical protein